MTARGEFPEALWSFRRVFIAVGGFSLAINLLLLVPAVYMLQMYDRVLTSRNEATLVMLSLLMVGLLALEAALEYVRSHALVRTSAALDLRLGPRVFDASFARQLGATAGSAADPHGDMSAVRRFLTGRSLLAFFDAPWTPVYIVVAFLLSPWLGLYALLAALVLLGLAWLNERATGPLIAQSGALAAAARQDAAGSLRNAEVVEAMGMLGPLRERWSLRQNRFLAVQAAASERAALIGAGTRYARLALQSGALGIGAWLVLANQLTPGGMIAGTILLGRALSPVDMVIATWREFVAAREAFARLNALLAAHAVPPEAIELPRPAGEIVAEGLIVAPPGGGTPILRGLRFRVPPGSVVGIVGPSASGKSTLARALVGVWPPAAGTLRLDGADVHAWDKARLGRWIGYLPQDVALFDGTVAENIARLGTLDSGRIVAAAKLAGVHEMVLLLPQGYETQIGPGGASLSAGQRQRVALARALYGEPALVVLDEPNSNLDEAGDAALLAAIESLRQARCTVFLVTHRVNVLRAVDSVMVLAGGSLRAFGPREEFGRHLGLRAPDEPATAGVRPPRDAQA